MEWDEHAIHLLLDGRLLNTIELEWANYADGSNPFRHPHFILLNLAIGGDRGGDTSNTKFPAKFEVDYVRVFQKIDKQHGAEH